MKKHFLITLIGFCFCCNLYGQKADLSPFTIQGYINADTGTVKLILLTDSSFYPKGINSLSAQVKNGRFSFQGYLPYPQGFELVYSSSYLSSLFVIEKGIQSMSINIDSNRTTPVVRNQVMKEYTEYKNMWKTLIAKETLLYHTWDSLDKVYQRKLPKNIELELRAKQKAYYAESDQNLLKYVTAYPNSYLAFWKFIRLSSFSGHEKIFDSIFNQLSDSLKNTYAGRVLSKNLYIGGTLGMGKRFPPLICISDQGKNLDNASFLKNQYTLIDFWYSNCGPCIAQFPTSKYLYDKYKGSGFEIVGVSTDKEKYKTDWQNAIKKYQLLWPQYWDINGVESTKMSINAFPTNFLLDKEGMIIRKNISRVELEEFLLKQIN
jgi:cytochrome oxidase Cu insertion factor (SCO1/SenC/PrrC family)